jgi:predicted PurR-regulated permease PerM
MLGLVLVLGYLSYLILRPFLAPLAWAIVFSIVFFPMYTFILRYIRWSTAAAALAVIIICLLILGPFSYFAYLLATELSNVSMGSADLEGIAALVDHPGIKPAVDKMLAFFQISQAELHASVVNSLSSFGKRLLAYVPGRLGDVVGAFVSFALMAFALFFFLRDGGQFLARIRDYMPFSQQNKDRLAGQVKDIVISTIYGGVVVALVQGIIGSVVFTVLAIPSPLLWGLAISISSFIPIVGSAIVWVPAVFYLMLKGYLGKALILALVGVLGISMVDNILRPVIIRGRIRMPLLVIFLSVLGGIEVFGLIGLIMGPLVLAVFVSVVDIFKDVEGVA